MLSATEVSGQQHRFERSVISAQARSTLESLFLSLIANSFIAFSMAALLWSDLQNLIVDWWLGGVLLLNTTRFIIAYAVRKRNTCESDPRFVLNFLAIGSLLAGISWALIPLVVTNVGDRTEYDTFVVFIIVGISAGALIQNTSFAKGAMFFFLPPLVALDFIWLLSGSLEGLIIGINSFLLTFMMCRSSLEGQKQFFHCTRVALEATEMARSLAEANGQIVRTNEQLEVLANRDVLTGLANRASFNRKLKNCLAASHGNGHETALIIFDLDRFKTINDTHGHKAGDALLKAFADVLTRGAYPGEFVARLGGDEFAAVITGSNIIDRARAFAEGVVEAFKEPLTIEGVRMHAGASAGIAFSPMHGRDADSTFSCADMALYAAKESGRRCAMLFDISLSDRLNRRRMIEASLTTALDHEWLEAYFQPQVALPSREVVGFEALLRWNHPELGDIHPAEIAEAAANCNITEQVSTFMMVKACDFLGSLPQHQQETLTLAVNISPRDFANHSPAETFLKIAEARGIAPASLEIEITEETFFDIKGSSDKLTSLKEAGFKIAVDDFGMGHSSLSYLIDMKIDRLKIDRSFITGIAGTPHNQALVDALLNMGRALGIDILAEGVETDDDMNKLVELGCNYAQGFLFAPAMPAGQASRWLAAHMVDLSGSGVLSPQIAPARRISGSGL